MFINIQIDSIMLKAYDQQFTLTTKKSLHIIFNISGSNQQIQTIWTMLPISLRYFQQLLLPYYGHYTRQPASAWTPSQELEDFVGAVCLPTCPCWWQLAHLEQKTPEFSSTVIPAASWSDYHHLHCVWQLQTYQITTLTSIQHQTLHSSPLMVFTSWRTRDSFVNRYFTAATHMCCLRFLNNSHHKITFINKETNANKKAPRRAQIFAVKKIPAFRMN